MKQRIITGLILLPLAFCGFFLLEGWHFALFIGAVCTLAAFEWAQLAGIKSIPKRCLYATTVALLLLICYRLRWQGNADNWENLTNWMVCVSLAWWCFAFCLVKGYPKIPRVLTTSHSLRWIYGLFILVPAWQAFVYIKDFAELGRQLIFWLLALIWLADSGAYFIGRAYGKHKLRAAVSPGKSWEGLAGGLMIALLPVLGYGLYLELPILQLLQSLWIATLVVLLSVLGDLTESLFKREVGVKDSGKLLPGHGGVLDRIDSLTAAAPCFLLLSVSLSKSLFGQ